MTQAMVVGTFKLEEWMKLEAKRLNLNISKICRDAVASAIFFRQQSIGALETKIDELDTLIRDFTVQKELIVKQKEEFQETIKTIESRTSEVVKQLKAKFPQVCRHTKITESGHFFNSLERGTDIVPHYFHVLSDVVGDTQAVLDYIKVWQDRGTLPNEQEMYTWAEGIIKKSLQ